MNIGEQVKELKIEAKWLDGEQEKRLASMLRQAADTIETLSAELMANTELPTMCKTDIEHDGCESCKYEYFPVENSYCQGCRRIATDKYIRKTTADEIRSMTDDELAEFLCKVKADYQWADHEFPDEDACGDWKEWLEQEAGE